MVLANCAAQGNPTHDAALQHLHAAILGVEQLHDPEAALAVLEEADKYLAAGCAPRCEEVLNSVYDSLVHADTLSPAKKRSVREPDLFRRFLHLVSKVDPQLTLAYADRFRHERPDVRLATWETANDLFEDDYSASLDIASLAASTSGEFPDAAVTYMRRLTARSTQDADRIGRTVINHVPDFAANPRLEVLAFLFGTVRVPELIETSVADKYIADGLPAGSIANGGLISAFVQQIGMNPLSDPRTDLFVLALTEAHLADIGRNTTQQIAFLKHAEARDAEALPKDMLAKVSDDVAKWMKGGDPLQLSTQDAENAFQTSKDDKFRNRATLLQAISLAQKGKLSEALNLLTSLPVQGRDNARDAVLMFVADAITTPEQAEELLSRTRSETRSEFVVGYAELATARIRAQQPSKKEHDLWSTLNAVEAAAGQLKAKQRLTLQLGAAAVWAQLSREMALAALDRSLKDLNEDKNIDGVPSVTLLLSVPGTTVEYTVARANLYQLIRTLAKRDLDSTLTHLANSNREDVLLRGVVAACVESLSNEAAKEADASALKR